MKKLALILFIFSIFSCQNNNRKKELELKERELDLKQKELELRDKELNRTTKVAISEDSKKEKNATNIKFSIDQLPKLVRTKIGPSFEILNDKTAQWDDYTFKNFILPKRTKTPTYPYIVAGDFDGNGQVDYSVLITNRERSNYKVVIFLDNGKSYDWEVESSNGISFFPKQNFTNYNRETANLKGDAVQVMQFESYAYLIYWNGKKFETISTAD